MAIRKRESNDAVFLKPFDLANVCKENARVDKFEINFPRIRTGELLPPTLLVDGIARLSAGELFRRNGRENLVICKNWMASTPVKKNISFREEQGAYLLRIHTSLNFTRFYQSNGSRLEKANLFNSMEQWDEEPSDISPNILFRKNEGELAKAKRIAIRPSDTNILCGKNWNNTENVPDLIKYQVGKFVELLNCHLSPMENIVLDTNDWTIPHLEVYWDLYHKDAHDYYHHTLKERLEEVIQCGSYLSVPTEKDGNLTIVKCNLYNDRSDDRISPQIQLSFYPKAKNRIRVEVKYIGSIRSLIQNRMKNLRNRYSLAALPEVIDNALSYATDTAQQFLSQLDMHDSPSRSIPNTFAMLSHRLYKEGAESQIITNRIIGKILHNNNISVDGETREAIQRLVISGVLRRVISRKRKAKSEPYYYTYTTMFAPIFRALRKEMKRK